MTLLTDLEALRLKARNLSSYEEGRDDAVCEVLALVREALDAAPTVEWVPGFGTVADQFYSMMKAEDEQSDQSRGRTYRLLKEEQ
jgi:hypothetical protein